MIRGGGGRFGLSRTASLGEAAETVRFVAPGVQLVTATRARKRADNHVERVIGAPLTELLRPRRPEDLVLKCAAVPFDDAGAMRRLSAALSVVFLVFSPAVALADALPPPRKITCPRGSQIVHDHGGTRCVKDPPKSCPPGWTGKLGGTCHLDLCQGDDECEGGKKCRKVDLCSNVEVRTQFGRVRGPELAGPPHRQKVRVFYDVCREGKCASPQTCGAHGVCLPPDVAGAAPAPANASEALSFSVDREELPPIGTPVVDPPDAGPPLAPITLDPEPEPLPPPGKSGGCAGCTTSAGGTEGALAFAFALACALRLRRRR